VDALICSACARSYPLDDPRWRCDCGAPLDIVFEAHFDLEAILARPRTLWRYREALPLIRGAEAVTLGEGCAPMLPMVIDGRQVWIVHDQLSPSGSYKDRGASLLISHAHSLGIREVIEDSSGNAGAAIAAYCARAGIACRILVPQGTSPDKTAQIQSYGADLTIVPGDREATATAALLAAESTFYASHSWSPFFFHGTKTWAYQVCQDLGWRAPDAAVLPAGNGTLLLGAWIGFSDLLRAGLVQRMPRLIAVQAAACAPLVAALSAGARRVESPARRGSTVAEGIAIAEPVRGPQMLQALRETGGEAIAVSEAEIVAALGDLVRRGVYVEPTSAATIAGLRRYLAAAPDDETIVSTLTGHGLKASAKVSALAETLEVP
jgi:threonine synthase